MKTRYFQEHWNDADGNPTGGISCGRGFTISWQNGPLGCGADRKDPNGAFVENIIDAAIGRIEHYENSKFACQENRNALKHLRLAAASLDDRTKDRQKRRVEGTHTE